ncbi:hypothetical protein [Mucilaginibacter auburnensis]|uniref:Uncharacterized protein n=1 Tax=Mucilaginibacter auburnensis TaxID=1457233 RepID=A0A2H9VUG0_9SPHI|nr:hypothetical protein [Mucilaginibacter auburnensis]PJJ84439.1 hypothetical protein CLV57_1451 [Mucilaginibacter auburnensis]
MNFLKSEKLVVLAACFLGLYYPTSAQSKMPNLQAKGLYMPANLKIDGKSDEWTNKFEAYNNSTDFYYTIANNDERLYIIIRATDRNVFNKIIEKGVTFSTKNGSSGNNSSFTFPYYINDTRRLLSLDLKGDMNNPSNKATDADIAQNNKLLREKHRFIKVEGIRGVDSLISIYNEKGIQVAELFDVNKAYTLEMLIDLKLLGVSTKNDKKISYQIKVNPIPGYAVSENSKIITSSGNQATPDQLAQLNVLLAKKFGGSDFRGEYVLATK